MSDARVGRRSDDDDASSEAATRRAARAAGRRACRASRPAELLHPHPSLRRLRGTRGGATDRPSLAIVEIDGRWQFTATYDDSRGRLVYPPAIFLGFTDWDVVGARDGSTFFRRDRKWRPPPPKTPLDYVEPGFISSKEWRRKMNIPDGTPT